jgi:hypothetical protein
MLENALADAPDRDTVRIPLFYAFATLKQDRLALSSIEPLLQRDYLVGLSGRSERSAASEDQQVETDEPVAAAPTVAAPDAAYGEVPANRSDAPPGERAELATAVARSYSNLGALETSLRYYRMALNGKLPETARAEVAKNISSIRAAIRRNANNAQRMPVIHKEVEQNHLVRPRLVAAQSAAPPAKVGGSTGGGSAQ